jgi:DNA-binding NarL/FixJ family response regulator
MLFPESSSLRVLVVGDDLTDGMALAASLADLDGLTSVGTARSDSLSMALRLREPTLILTLGVADLGELPQPVVSIVRDPIEGHEALEFGARGILLFGTESPRIEAALRAVASGLRVVDDGLDLPPSRLSNYVLAPDVPSLTPREREVLDLLADGLSNKEIAADLDVGERTAKFHVAGLLKKMNATTRTEAVVRAARLGLLLL